MYFKQRFKPGASASKQINQEQSQESEKERVWSLLFVILCWENLQTLEYMEPIVNPQIKTFQIGFFLVKT